MGHSLRWPFWQCHRWNCMQDAWIWHGIGAKKSAFWKRLWSNMVGWSEMQWDRVFSFRMQSQWVGWRRLWTQRRHWTVLFIFLVMIFFLKSKTHYAQAVEIREFWHLIVSIVKANHTPDFHHSLFITCYHSYIHLNLEKILWCMWGCIDWSFGLSARLLITIQIDKPPGTFLAYLALQIFSSLVHSWFLIFQKHLKSGKGTSPKPTLRMISKWYWISIFGQLLVHFLVPCTLFLVPFLQILKTKSIHDKFLWKS